MKTKEFQLLILKLLSEKAEINLSHILQATGVDETPTNRRAVQRVLKKLIDQHLVSSKGKARARVYFLRAQSFEQPSQHDMPEAAKYILQPAQAKHVISYNQTFLESYQPNETFYLDNSIRQQLLQMGAVESIIKPAGTYARNILAKLLIDLSWNSSRLEGNTYTLLETQRLIEFGETAVGKAAFEAQMILNHKSAIEYLLETANENHITSHDIRSIHALLSENLLGDPGASGRLREIAVGISGTAYMPLDNPHVLRDFFGILIKKLNQIENPFEQSFFALLHLSYLQAFEDVNKRTARLIANIPFIKSNLKPLSFIDVTPQDYASAFIRVYETNELSLLKSLYVSAYKKSAQRYSAMQQSMDEPNLFKLKYRSVIHDIIRRVILEKIPNDQLVLTIRHLIAEQHLSAEESNQLFEIIETEMIGLHDGNIARFKIRPSEFQQWKKR